MSRDSRISLQLTDLPIDSVTKIFTFIRDSLEGGLSDIDAFETTLNRFNILEKYFTCEYITTYYSSQKLSLWLKTQKEESHVDDETLRKIKANAENIVASIEGMKNSTKRLAQNYKRKNKSFKGLQLQSQEENVIDFRIPLYFIPKTINDYEKSRKTFSKLNRRSEFKKDVFAIFNDIFSEEDLEWFFNNSFYFKNNPYPVYLLHLEVKNIGEFKNKLYQLYDSYTLFYQVEKKKYEDYFTNQIDNFSKQLSNKKIRRKFVDKKGLVFEKDDKDPDSHIVISKTREKFYPNPEKLKGLKESFDLPTITKVDFAKIAYNAFPFIREAYTKRKIKTPSYTLDEFLILFSNSIRVSKRE